MGPDLFELHARVEEQHWWFLGRREIMRGLVEAVAPTGSTVVDVGCGTGANIAALADRYVAVGIDTSSEAIRHSRARFPAVQFIEGTAGAALPTVREPIGCVLLMDVLEHVRDDFQLLGAILAALPVGGHVLITVPADMRLWSAHDIAFDHYRRYDRARLQAVWSRQPVRVRLISHFCSRLYWPIRAIRTVRRRLDRTAGGGRSDLAMPPALVNDPLRRVFAAEGKRLDAALDAGISPFRHGSSMIAILEREAGPASLEPKPPEYATDPHDPSTPKT